MATLGVGQGIRRADIGLLTVTLSLVLLGLAALFSFSLNADSASGSAFLRQAIYSGIGLVLAVVLFRFDYRFITGLHWVLYGLGIVSLLGVVFFGRTINGTTGWFAIGPAQFQPVEFVKVIMAVVLAKVMGDSLGAVRSWSFIFRSGVVVAVPVGLVMAQPDFGSAAVLVAMWAAMILLSPVPRRRIVIIGLVAVLAVGVGWTTVLKTYQKDRIMTFLNPSRDALGAGYNVHQALAAIGSGKFFGRGLGLGPQSQLNFLPERQTDFIFASICEELGFLGGGVIIILYGLYFFRLVRLLDRIEDPATSLLVIGLGSITLIHVVVNIGMNLGLLPVTGIPLPYVSSGGSALLAGFISLGLLESIAIRQGTRVS